MSTAIRIAGLQDLDLIAPLFDGYRQFYGRPSDEALARAFLQERISRKESVVFVAEVTGHGAGFMQLYPSFTSMGAARIWILNDLFVAPDHRRGGIATEFLNAAAAFSGESGAVRLTLATAVTNHAAQALYQRHGWKKDTDFLHYNFAVS